MTVEERHRRRFSEDFRKQQVQLIEGGELSIGEVSRLYEVKRTSIKRWLIKYGTQKFPEKILITNGSEIDRLKDLEREVRRLKEIIGEQQVHIINQKGIIRLAERRLGNGFEKK